MKKIFAIAWKDAIIRFASSSELLFFIILPVVFTFLLAGGTPSGDTDNRIRLLVVDEARTTVSEQIIGELQNSTAVRPEVVSRDEAQKQFDERRASAVFIIPSGIDISSLQNGLAEVELFQQPNNLNATIAERAVLTAIRRVSSAISAAQNAVKQREAKQPFASDVEKQAYFETSLELAQNIQADAPERVTVIEGTTPDTVEYDPRANSSAGQLITWVFIPLFGISALFAYERQQGTLRRLLTTPSRKSTFLLGIISGQVAMALIQMVLLVGFGVVVMKLNWGREPLALSVILLASALAAAAFGTTMGTFVKTEGQASGLSIMFGMVMALMGGCWYPLELFPSAIQNAVKILPTTWAMQGLLDLVLRGKGLVDILPEAGVLLGFAVVFFAVGVMRFRYE
ncbi:MAG: ABC transporter permease [Chloroflexi bacterium]|nr:ABC transporter permease [Chloroflexota bacterium]